MRKKLLLLAHITLWLVPTGLLIHLAENFEYFSKKDNTIWIPVLFGTLMNAVIFYGNTSFLLPMYLGKQKWMQYLGYLMTLFIGATLLEILMDFTLMFIYYPGRTIEPQNIYMGVSVVNSVFLFASFIYRFSADWYKSERQKRQLLAHKNEAELAMLKAQVSPHFLFNTLNNLYYTAQLEGNEKIAGLIMKLSYLMRYTVYDTDASEVLLDNEIRFINDFIDMQKLRFSETDNVNVSFNVYGKTKHVYIAPLLLIPIVENAFKHGINLSEACSIEMELEITTEMIIFRVTNNKPSVAVDRGEGASGLGLVNLKKRMMLIYGEKGAIEISDNDLYQVTIKITRTT